MELWLTCRCKFISRVLGIHFRKRGDGELYSGPGPVMFLVRGLQGGLHVSAIGLHKRPAPAPAMHTVRSLAVLPRRPCTLAHAVFPASRAAPLGKHRASCGLCVALPL